MDCGPFLAIHTEQAVRTGKVSEMEVNYALANTITVQMRLGMFDGPNGPYANLGPRDVCTPAHQQLALQAAREGIVLLKNIGRALPLSPQRHRTVAVIGPNSDATVTMIGNYAGKLISFSGISITYHNENYFFFNLGWMCYIYRCSMWLYFSITRNSKICKDSSPAWMHGGGLSREPTIWSSGSGSEACRRHCLGDGA